MAIASVHVGWGRSASQSTASNASALLTGRKKSSEYLIGLWLEQIVRRLKGKGKVLPYSLPSVGPGADLCVQSARR